MTVRKRRGGKEKGQNAEQLGEKKNKKDFCNKAGFDKFPYLKMLESFCGLVWFICLSQKYQSSFCLSYQWPVSLPLAFQLFSSFSWIKRYNIK